MRERWLGRLVEGETYLAFGLPSRTPATMAAALRTTAAADRPARKTVTPLLNAARDVRVNMLAATQLRDR